MEDPWMSVSAISDYIELSIRRTRQLLAGANLPHANWGTDKRSRRWRRSTIDAWLSGMVVGGAPKEECQAKKAEQPKAKKRATGEPDLSVMGAWH